MGSVIPRKKVFIPRFTEESIPRLGTEGNGMKKLVLQKILLQQTEYTRQHVFVGDMLRNKIQRVFYYF
jgi:hypothetical protein